MTERHVRLIVGIPNLTAPQCAVLVWLAIHANAQGYAWPGIAVLQQETRLKRRIVIYALRELEARHIITRSRGTSKTDYKTMYFMAFAEEQEPVTQPLAKPRKATSSVNPPNFWEDVKRTNEQERERPKNGTAKPTHPRRPR